MPQPNTHHKVSHIPQNTTRSSLILIWICFSAFLLNTYTTYSQEKLQVILDADTGNEVDDLYALSRALIEPSWHIISLNATQWQTSHWTVPESMENSHRLNQVLLGHLGLSVPTKRGGVARMYDWGDQAQHSAAAYEIIKQAKQMPKGQKLTVIALGALTNVASALYIDPAITSRIKLYWLGTHYDFQKSILRRNDFNSTMDSQAVDIVFMSDVETHIIPINIARKMEFTFKETAAQLQNKHPLGNFLIDRWYQHLDAGRKKRVLWDIALIEAILHPEWTEEVIITTSKDNGEKKINYYKNIDVVKMKAEFFDKLLTYFKK